MTDTPTVHLPDSLTDQLATRVQQVVDQLGLVPEFMWKVHEIDAAGAETLVYTLRDLDFDEVAFAQIIGRTGTFRRRLFAKGKRGTLGQDDFRIGEDLLRQVRPHSTAEPKGETPPTSTKADPLAALTERLDKLLEQRQRDDDRLTLRDLLPLLTQRETLSAKDILAIAKSGSSMSELVSAMASLRELTGGDGPAPMDTESAAIQALTSLVGSFGARQVSPTPAMPAATAKPKPKRAPMVGTWGASVPASSSTPTMPAQPAPPQDTAFDEPSDNPLHDPVVQALFFGFTQGVDPGIIADAIDDILAKQLGEGWTTDATVAQTVEAWSVRAGGNMDVMPGARDYATSVADALLASAQQDEDNPGADQRPNSGDAAGDSA